MLAGAVFAGQRLPPEVQIGAGWGALCVSLTVWGVLLPLNLAIPAAGFALTALSALALRSRRPSSNAWRTLARVVLVTLPLWLIMAPIRPSQPDTWINLLPNALYLVDFGRLPTAALPPSHSYLPAAPYNTQFLSYIGGLIWPDYPAAGMSLINVLLLVTVGLLIARAIAIPAFAGDRVPGWGAIAGGMLLATLVNPSFVPRFHLSPYGETALAVTSAIAAWLLVATQGEVAAGRVLRGAVPAIGLVLAAMVNVKQSGLGLVAANFGAGLMTSWAESGRQWQGMRRVIGLSVLPALGLYALWRYHVAVAGVNELKPLPLAQWNWGSIPALLTSAAEVISEKAVYFSFVAMAVVALPVLLRRQGWTQATRLLFFFTNLFILYNGFLLVIYMGVFSPTMSSAAHSLFRYNTHLSLVLVLALALAARDLLPAPWFERVRSGGGAAILVVALLAPVAFAKRLRFDLDMPQPLVWDLAKHLAPYLEDGDRLALLLPGDNDSVATMLAGVLADTPPRRRRLAVLRRSDAEPAALEDAARRGYKLALVSCSPNDWTGVPPGQAVLLRYDRGGWQFVSAWPYPRDAGGRWQHILAWAPLCRRG
jgi:hypothetical protein